jgi:hypothetical protein
MTPAASIKTDPLLFDKLLEPLQHPLAELAQQPLSQAAGKLTIVVLQTADHLTAAKPKSSPAAPRTITSSLSQLFQRTWRLRRQPLRLWANC